MKKRRKKKKGGLKMALTASGQPVLIGYKEWLKKRQEQGQGELTEDTNSPGALGQYRAMVFILRNRLMYLDELMSVYEKYFTDPKRAKAAANKVRAEIKKTIEMIDTSEDKSVKDKVIHPNWISKNP